RAVPSGDGWTPGDIFIDGGFNDFIEILGLVVKGQIGGVNLARHAPLMDFPALFEIADGRHTHAPVVFDAGKIIFRGDKHVKAVASYGQAELVGFISAGSDTLARDI